jgi:triacylglycerol esterase/lipase EstA (alpha/beta hydrolase family)
VAAFKYWNGIPKYLADHGYGIHEFFGPWRGPHRARLDSFRRQIEEVCAKTEKVHIIAHSMGTIDMIDLLKEPPMQSKLASVTFVSPPFAGTPMADMGLYFGDKLFSHTNESLSTKAATKIVETFKKPAGVLIGTILSRPKNYPRSYFLKLHHILFSRYLRSKNRNEENDGLVPLDSQLIAKSLGDFTIEFPGDHVQVIGGGPWPDHVKTAHEMYLDHAIFLAEYDFKTAKYKE